MSAKEDVSESVTIATFTTAAGAGGSGGSVSSVFNTGGYVGPPLTATPCLPTIDPADPFRGVNPAAPNVACAGGHRASEDATEYIDGEIVTYCVGCGERLIIPRVPGSVPVLKLKALIGAIMGVGEGDDADFNLSDVLGWFADIKYAIGIEDDALARAHDLIGLAEKLIRQKLAERAI